MPSTRRRSAVASAAPASPIEAAIDAVAARRVPDIVSIGLQMFTKTVVMEAAEATISLEQGNDPELIGHPRLLLLEPSHGAWRPIVLAPGTWELRRQPVTASRLMGLDGRPLG